VLPDLIADRKLDLTLRLGAIRLLQMHLGDLTSKASKGTVWEGYTRRSDEAPVPEKARAALREAFPSGNADLDRELGRTLAMIEDDDAGVRQRLVEQLTARSHPTEDVHNLIVLARLRGPRTAAMTAATATALLRLDAKMDERKLNRDSNWPLRLGEMYVELAHKDPALNAALLAHADFGRPDHALFAHTAGFDRVAAADRFLARAAKDTDYAWNSTLIEVVGAGPPERVLPVLRRLWGQQGQDEAILPLLARKPQAEDRARFVEALNSARLATMQLAVEALAQLPARNDRDEVLRLLLALRRLPSGKEGDGVRKLLLAALQRSAGREFADADAWTAWFAKTYPALAARVADDDGVDVAGWGKRLAGIDWSSGDAGRGQQIFVRASCASCHSGTQALGPDLQGVVGRFSRADLFTAIIQPSKDVSPRYRTTILTTSNGKTHQGLIVYEAVDSVILQTGPAETVRLTNTQIAERRLSARSLMPAGLLDRLTDREIADLYAYLKGMGKKQG
jgi:putative heme-binding domain-containing protein